MAHWAEVDENNLVVRVVVGSNDDPDEGHQWIVENLGGTWLKTSYNGSIRGRFAGVGYIYDQGLDEFLPPKPLESWVWDSEQGWIPPIAKPTNGFYNWDESAVAWVEVEDEAINA